MADNADPTQYDPRAQAMEEIHFDWRSIVCCMVALSPFTLNNSISLALVLCILTWTTPHGLNVTSAIPSFIYSVGPGNLFKLSDPSVFFAHSFVVGSFRYPLPSPCHLIYSISILFPPFFKIGQKPLCPDDKTPKNLKKARRAERIIIRKPSDTVQRIGVDPCTRISESDYLLQTPLPDV